jgi:hypothetical protein
LTVTGLVTAGSATITGAATVGTTLGVTGVSTFAAGTLLLPALTTTGDTNTGIYFPAADTFAVTTGGAERYRVDSSGNVGVGLTPRAKLDVNGGLLVNNYTTSTNYAPLSVTTASTITTPSTFTNAINIWNPTTVGAYSNITFGYNALGLTNAPAYIGFVSTTSTSGGFGDLVFGTRSVGTDTAATERVRIDSVGNVGVGVSPGVKLDVLSASAEGTIRLTSTIDGSTASPKGSSLSFRSGSSSTETARIASFNRFSNVNGGDLVFSTADSSQVLQTRATIDSSGNLLMGTATANYANTNGFLVALPTDATYISVGHSTGTSTGSFYCSFGYNGTQIGSITQNGTTGVLYNIVSDYRLKESVKPLNGCLARVNALKPSIYNWKSDGSSGEGFLAHELAEVVPFAVSGEKDAVNTDGSIKSQGIDMSRIVPILVAAIQELTAEVNALKNA